MSKIQTDLVRLTADIYRLSSESILFGKTIRRYSHSKDRTLFCLTFTDNTFIVFFTTDKYDEPSTVEVYQDELIEDELIELNLVSREDYDAWIDERAKAKEQFEELKKKWGF